MVFTKVSDTVSSVSTRFSDPKPSTVQYKPPSFPPNPGSPHGRKISSPGRQSSFRLSSSFQDFSTCDQLDLEGGDRVIGVEETSTHGLPPSLLKKATKPIFSKERVTPRVLFSLKKKGLRIIFALCCLLLFASISFSLLFLYSNWSQGQFNYYVVLDCGSTGTRVYVYQASLSSRKNDNLPILLKSLPEDFQEVASSPSGRAYNRIETEPGLDKLFNNVTGLREALNPLLQWAENQIPAKSHKSTSLFLYATAGVRRLPRSDSDLLLSNAWSVLKSSPFLCTKEWIKIITGMEEAYYGWIALNYHMGVLGSIPKRETFGALDLGGSSLQVTFEGKKVKHDETSLSVSIGPVSYQLNAYSLAGYGLNDAFDKSVAYLLKMLPQITETNGPLEIKHPCLQSGYKRQYMCSNCASVHLEDGTSPTGGKRLGGKGKLGVPVQLVGVPKWEECRELAKVAVNASEWSDQIQAIDCEVQPCALAEKFPRPVGQFYVMSGFYVVYRFFGLTSDATLDDVLDKGREFCEKTWDAARTSVVPQPFIEQYCFRAPYVVLLLREGLHITDSSIVVGSGSTTWTLGVALFEAGKTLPFGGKFRSYEILQVKINPVIVFAIMVASLFFLLCVLSCAGKWRMPTFFRRSYLPLSRHASVTSTAGLNVPAPFRFQRWSPIISKGDEKGKIPLSPTVSRSQQSPSNTTLYSSSSSVLHSYSSGNLGQMQFDNSTLGSLWAPHRSQMQLQSRRSQSREDLISSIPEAKS